MPKYKLVNDSDGNDESPLNSTTESEAMTEAFEMLGYRLVKIDTSELDNDEFCEQCVKNEDCNITIFANCPDHPAGKSG